MGHPFSGVQKCCNCGESADVEMMSKDHDGNWFCKECEEPREPREYPSHGDAVRVTKEKLDEFVNLDLKEKCSGVGRVTKNWDSGWFTVEFKQEKGFCIEHGFYGSDLRVVKKARDL